MYSPRFYSPVESNDVEVAIQFIHKKFPISPIIGVGHSMGAAMLTKYLGSVGSNTLMEACVSLSNPWNFNAIANNLESSFVNRTIYNKHFLSYWLNAFSRNVEVFKTHSKLNYSYVQQASTIREFEERLSIIIYGRENYTLEEYFRDCSCFDSVKSINIPFFMIHALDDPVVPKYALPLTELEKNENCFTCLTKSGGHSGWLKGHFNPRGLCFADQLTMEFIDAFLEQREKKSILLPSMKI